MYSSSNTFIPIPKEPHNKNVRNNAEGHAYDMRKNPSYLEKQMIEFLDSHKIKYEFQKIFYIRSSGGFIKQYYIADFYIPKKHIIIEVDGKFHKDQTKLDNFRTWNIQKHYPKVRVIRWEYNDFHSYVNMKKLLEEIK
jgi:very-short-patch-repair endonuclease